MAVVATILFKRYVIPMTSVSPTTTQQTSKKQSLSIDKYGFYLLQCSCNGYNTYKKPPLLGAWQAKPYDSALASPLIW